MDDRRDLCVDLRFDTLEYKSQKDLTTRTLYMTNVILYLKYFWDVKDNEFFVGIY